MVFDPILNVHLRRLWFVFDRCRSFSKRFVDVNCQCQLSDIIRVARSHVMTAYGELDVLSSPKWFDVKKTGAL